MKARFVLAGIVLLGAALRLWGLAWGLPQRTDLHPDEHDYVISHALAVGSKYTAALACVAPLLAVGLLHQPVPRRLKGLLVLGAVSLLACFAVTPFSFIRFHDLLRALAYENAHTHGHHTGFSIPADGRQYHLYLYQLVAAWPFSLGLPLYLCALAGVASAAVRRRREFFVPLAFLGVFFAVTGSWTFTPIRYYIPIVVLGAVLAGVWQGRGLTARPQSWRFRAALAIAVATAVYTLAFTLSTTARFTRETRLQADRWMRENLRPGQVVHIFGWWRYMGFLDDARYVMKTHRETALNHAPDIGTNDLIEVSSLHYLRWKRHGIDSYRHLYERLSSGDFECVARFDAPFLNRDFYGRMDPMFRSYFIAPTVEIYRRVEPKNPPATNATPSGS